MCEYSKWLITCHNFCSCHFDTLKSHTIYASRRKPIGYIGTGSKRSIGGGAVNERRESHHTGSRWKECMQIKYWQSYGYIHSQNLNIKMKTHFVFALLKCGEWLFFLCVSTPAAILLLAGIVMSATAAIHLISVNYLWIFCNKSSFVDY